MSAADCESNSDHLALYADGELDAESAAKLETHLAACPVCIAQLARLAELSEALRERAPYHRAPEALRERLLSKSSSSSTAAASPKLRPAPPRDWQRWLLPLAASLLVAVGVDWRLVSQHQQSALDDEIVAAHVRSLLADHLADVPSTDRHTVKPWFAGKLDYTPTVHDLASDGYPLTGGRLDYIEHREVAALIYRRRQHVINLFVWPEPGPGGARREEIRSSYSLIGWNANGMRYEAVSDLNMAELSTFADELTAHAADS